MNKIEYVDMEEEVWRNHVPDEPVFENIKSIKELEKLLDSVQMIELMPELEEMVEEKRND